MTRSVFVVAAAAASALLAFPVAATAQTPRDSARLIVTVADPSGGVIPKAIVTVTGQEDATRTPAVKPALTSDRGVATFEGLAPGRYLIQAEFTGFSIGKLGEVRLRAGENRHVVILALKGVQDSVTVSRDAQAAATDPRGTAFKTILTREEINALSDDPAEMAQQLMDMAGGNAVIKVDGFSGAPLPPKAMIKSIHIVRDAFAAENHSAEVEEIDIITQPGVGPLTGGVTSRFRDGSMSGRSPFTPIKGPERTQNYQGNVGGTIIKEKSSFALAAGRGWSFDTPNLNVALPDGTHAEALALRRPNDTWQTYGLVDYAVTRDHVVRVAFDVSNSRRRNVGVGAYDLASRAYGTDARQAGVRIQESGPVGRRSFLTSRLQIEWADTETHAAVEAPTLRVTDAFTSGGAQVRGGNHPRDFEFASDLDHIRGKHSVRAGVLLEGGRYRTDDSSNYLGTFLFTSLAAYEAGQPASYTRRIGDPLIQYWNVRAGAYVQDDIRVSKAVVLSPGIRYEAQTHLGGSRNLGPRMGATWAPFKSGRTTLRASYGLFFGYLNTGTYEQTLRVDGFRQQELNILNPTYPDPGDIGSVRATNRYLLGPDVRMVRTRRFSGGIDQTLSPKLRVSATYSDTRATGLLRGQNLNAPVGGVRPDPAFANVIETVSEGHSRTQQIAANLTVNLSAGQRGANQPRVNWRRETVRFSYWLSRAENNVDGAFAVPASGTLGTEWAPAPGDRRHRVALSIGSQALKNLNTTLSLQGNTGTPYTVTTGLDGNGDLIFNDRPAGTTRNSARTSAQYTWSLNSTYSLSFKRPGGAAPYRVSFTVNATNLVNHANYSGFSGVMTSPFFQKATSVSNPRRIDLGMNISF